MDPGWAPKSAPKGDPGRSTFFPYKCAELPRFPFGETFTRTIQTFKLMSAGLDKKCTDVSGIVKTLNSFRGIPLILERVFATALDVFEVFHKMVCPPFRRPLVFVGGLGIWFQYITATRYIFMDHLIPKSSFNTQSCQACECTRSCHACECARLPKGMDIRKCKPFAKTAPRARLGVRDGKIHSRSFHRAI